MNSRNFSIRQMKDGSYCVESSDRRILESFSKELTRLTDAVHKVESTQGGNFRLVVSMDDLQILQKVGYEEG